MRIRIVGGGEVGTSIATDLAEAHEVVVDADRDRVDELSDRWNVLAIHGDGTDLDTLGEADIEATDVAIAATDHDETNLAVCGTVTTTSDILTICQVEAASYLETWRQSPAQTRECDGSTPRACRAFGTGSTNVWKAIKCLISITSTISSKRAVEPLTVR